MPLGRYFACAGSVLIALLFLADWYIPALSAATDRAGVDKSIIRIHSGHRWPEALVFDTSIPTIVPPQVTTAEVPVQQTPRDAFAALPQPMPVASLAPKIAAKRTAKARAKIVRGPTTRRIASYRFTPPGDPFQVSW